MCGIIGVFNPNSSPSSPSSPSSHISQDVDMLNTISHRGHESYGISFFDNHKNIHKIKNNHFIGKIKKIDIEKVQQQIKYIRTSYFIGHTRYSTSGLKNNVSIQPFNGTVETPDGGTDFILVHNGNIQNISNLTKYFNIRIDKTKTDSELLLDIIQSYNQCSFFDILKNIMSKILGVYCLLIGTKDGIYVLRDTYGIRPLSLCFNEKTNSYCVISENSDIEHKHGYRFVNNIKPGTIGKLDRNGYSTLYSKFNIFTPCSFEYIYFLNKSSIVDDVDVSVFRYKCGVTMAKNDTDFKKYENVIICGVPETGITSGIGYADTLDLKYQQVITKKEEGRTFILGTNKERIEACEKFEVSDIIKNKILVLIDDSLVRGNTLTKLIQKCKDKGVKEIHIRIVSPPVKSQCYYGIDIPTKNELIASYNSVDKIQQIIGCNSLQYLSITEMLLLINNKHSCVSCFTGIYNRNLLEW